MSTRVTLVLFPSLSTVAVIRALLSFVSLKVIVVPSAPLTLPQAADKISRNASRTVRSVPALAGSTPSARSRMPSAIESTALLATVLASTDVAVTQAVTPSPIAFPKEPETV